MVATDRVRSHPRMHPPPPRSNTYIDAQRSGMPLISRTEEVAVYSDRNYKKFEQVFINYGEKVRPLSPSSLCLSC